MVVDDDVATKLVKIIQEDKVQCRGGKLAAAAFLLVQTQVHSVSHDRGGSLKGLIRSAFNHFLKQKGKRVYLQWGA